MSSLTHALYSDLLLDLQPYVSPEVYDLCEAGKIDLFPGCTERAVACMQLTASLLKKYKELTQPDADGRALAKFREANELCGTWSLHVESLFDEVLVSNLRRSLDRFFFKGANSYISDDLVTLISESDLVGPGVSVGGRGTDFYTKLFSGPLTCTSRSLYIAYRSYIGQFESWRQADDLRAASFGDCDVVEGNRLTFVPKTYDVSRSICIEPVLNMLVQKGLGNALERRLRQYFGIDLAVQQAKNRDLARIGSETGEFSTIDLSSASDTISWKMIQEFFPRHMVSLLRILRSPTSAVSLTGESLSLNMVSTMGNGFTFPLQTVLFASVVEACALTYESTLECPRGSTLGDYGVNGDDIVVPKGIHDAVVRLLSILGFKVNKTKSFHEGPFRESCGGDFFNGSPVRGVYIKTLSDLGSRYSAINLLNRWSARHQIPLRRTIRRLLRTVEYLPVPPWEDSSAGIHVPYSLIKHLRRDKNTKSILYRRLVFEPVKLRISDCEIVIPFKEKTRIYNPNGLLVSFLHGCVKGVRSKKVGSHIGTITIRHDRGWFRKRIGIAPNWDCTDAVLVPISDKRQWETAVWLNLNG